MRILQSTLLAFCLSSSVASGQTVHEVMVGQAGANFSPSTVNIEIGDTVRWVWVGIGHNVVSGTFCVSDGLFTSGTAAGTTVGTIFEFIFDDAFVSTNPVAGGNYSYFCAPHCALFNMVGSVVVNVPPPPPNADFSAFPTSGDFPLTVDFENDSSGTIDSHSWDFGDSNTSTEVNPSYTYLSPGIFTVSLTVTNVSGSDTMTCIDCITVTDPSPPPTNTTHEVMVGSGGGLFVFDPDTVTVAVDDIVRWVWQDPFHNVASGTVDPGNGTIDLDGAFDSGSPAGTGPGTIFEVTFDDAFLAANPRPDNTYPYLCTPHATLGMLGTVIVDVDGPDYIRGDCNGDGGFDISDPITSLGGLFSGGLINCRDACDCNDDGGFDISDAITALANLFSGGAPPPDPFPGCGPDPTADTLDCILYTACL